jgi:hypothetical protein
MAWTRVLSADTANITTCLSVMTTMHSYYSGVTVSNVQNVMAKNPNIELWLYTDGTNQIVAAFNPDVMAQKVHVYMLGIGTFGTQAGIGAILMSAIKNNMARYGINYIYGTAPVDGTTKGKAFYNALVTALTVAGFYAVRNTNPSGSLLQLEALLNQPSEPFPSLFGGLDFT